MAAEEVDREVEDTLEAVRRATGVDFRRYARSTVERRLRDAAAADGGIAEARRRALREPAAMARLVAALCVSVTALFRDPGFYSAFREKALPLLRGRPTLRFWHAGCATGEEVFSMAILLQEAGLHERSRLYGTDIHEPALERARSGALPLDVMREYTRNYQLAGCTGDFSACYAAGAGGVTVRPGLRARVHFARHDLAAGEPFAEFDAVVCRNVLIYFDDSLKERVYQLLHGSLVQGGVLALGHAEEVPRALRDEYEVLDQRERIYRRRT